MDRKMKLRDMKMPSAAAAEEEDMLDLEEMDFEDEEMAAEDEMDQEEYAMSPEEMMEALEKMGYRVAEPEEDEEEMAQQEPDPEDDNDEGDLIYS